jgi:peptidase E
MTKYILHGGYTSTENDLNAGFYREISKHVPENGNILLVYFSRDDENYDEVFKQDSEKIVAQAEGKKLNLKMASKENFENELDWTDSIYMRGGDTQKLIDTLKKYPEFGNKIRNKIVSGSSAGAYAVSTYYYSNSNGQIQKGLGIVPLRVICHYKSEIHENVGGDPVELMEDYPEDLELVVLKDFEWKIYEF